MSTSTMHILDPDLARASAEGDKAAFENIYRSHFRRVYSLCLRMLGNSTEAEDVTQDVFVKLYHKIGTFQGNSAFSTWLYRLTVNTVLMHIRHRQSKQKEHLAEEERLRRIIDMNQVKQQIEMSLVNRITLEQAIIRLPIQYRTQLVLHDIEGYEHQEIARMLGIKVGTSKSRLHKARLELRRLLLCTQAMHPEMIASRKL